ncbi:MAG: bifunctional diaminohydroxyphosphoribosylaminopyrimidine deaminase/5-amino-6-(5-phosphoribosylamino)uracil reductase RibD [Actinomycetota bacterium]
MVTNDDVAFMKQALALARKERGRTSPNPTVGSVVVANGEVIGAGRHRGPGTPHGEAAAVAAAGPAVAGSTVYVTLEPCAHHGRTPPCTEALIAAGVSRVVAAIEDPDPRVSGRGFAALRAAGIEVEDGCLADEAAELNRAYLIHRSQQRPMVVCKTAATLDGKTSAGDGSSQWITGPQARADVHRVRSRMDAICAGIGTVLADDPSLTVRSGGKHLSGPLRVIVDSKARTPPGTRVLDGSAPTLIAVAETAPGAAVAGLTDAGAEVVRLPEEGGRVSIPALTSHLARMGVLSVLLEGGPTLAAAFRAARLIDRYVIYLGPKLIADGAKGILEGPPASSIGLAEELEIVSVRKIGLDIKIEAVPATLSESNEVVLAVGSMAARPIQ